MSPTDGNVAFAACELGISMDTSEKVCEAQGSGCAAGTGGSPKTGYSEEERLNAWSKWPGADPEYGMGTEWGMAAGQEGASLPSIGKYGRPVYSDSVRFDSLLGMTPSALEGGHQ